MQINYTIIKNKNQRGKEAKNYGATQKVFKKLSKRSSLAKIKYRRIEIRVDKRLGEQFIQLIEKQGMFINQWNTEQTEKYLENFSKNT